MTPGPAVCFAVAGINFTVSATVADPSTPKLPPLTLSASAPTVRPATILETVFPNKTPQFLLDFISPLSFQNVVLGCAMLRDAF